MTAEGPPTSPGRKSVPGWLVFVVLLALGVWGARRFVLAAAVKASVKTAKEISESLPEPWEQGQRPEEDLLFPLWPVGPGAKLGEPSEVEEAAAAGEAVDGSAGGKKRRSVQTLGPRPKDARATVEQVLHWAAHQIVPRGITRPANGEMPAGIELHDVGALGLGLLPGDRLLTVDGISVLERSQVVGAVLGARSRRAGTMTAGLVRRTKEGPVHFTVVVEQPYPEDIPEANDSADSLGGPDSAEGPDSSP